MLKFRHIALLSQLICLSALADVPVLGGQGNQLSVAQQKAIGVDWTKQFYHVSKTIEDPIYDHFSHKIIESLLPNAQLNDSNVYVLTVDNQEFNAFSVIGNIVGVHQGLFFQLNDVHQFAGVLAHELAHLRQQHMLRKMEQGGQQGMILLAAIAASLVVADSNGELANAMLMSSQANYINKALRYSRSMEQEADRIGIDLLGRSGFDSRGLYESFLHLEKEYSGTPMDIEYLMTHPLPANRLADLRPRSFEGTPISSHIETLAKEFIWIQQWGSANKAEGCAAQFHKKKWQQASKCYEQLYAKHPESTLPMIFSSRAIAKIDEQKGYKKLLNLSTTYPDDKLIQAELFQYEISLSLTNQAFARRDNLLNWRFPQTHKQLASLAAKRNDTFYTTKHHFLYLWYQGNEQQSIKYMSDQLSDPAISIITKSKLRAFYSPYINAQAAI